MTRRLFLAAALIACLMLGTTGQAELPSWLQPKLPATLGPYLQNPAPDGMTVCFVAQGAKNVRVAWQEDGSQGAPTETPAKANAVPGTPWTVWKARLVGLRAAEAVRYRVRYELGGKFGETAKCRFRAPDPKADSYRAAFFNNVHNNIATLEAVMRHVKPEDYEAAFLLGDMWTDPDASAHADRVFRTFGAYLRLFDAAEKPMFLIRGNHETRGNFADKMALLFDLPQLDAKAGLADQNWYFTYRPGPVWFLALDGGEDFIKRYDLFQPMRKRQADWIKGLLDRKAGEDAPWRILLTHMPLYNDTIWNSEPCRQMWEPVLKGARIDLELGAHEHHWKLLPKGKTYTIAFDGHYPDMQDPQQRKTWTCTTPWPVMIGGGPTRGPGGEEATVMFLKADRRRIEVRMIGANGGKTLLDFKLPEEKQPTPSLR